jgi:putative transposase
MVAPRHRHDLGQVGPDRWMNVTAADPMWTGKSFDDLMMVRHRLTGERDRSGAVKARALAELDAAAHRGKVLRGLLPTVVTDGTYDRYEADFMRFMSTAERDFDAPEPMDLFDGIVDLQATAPEPDMSLMPSTTPTASPLTPSTSSDDDDDLME